MKNSHIKVGDHLIIVSSPWVGQTARVTRVEFEHTYALRDLGGTRHPYIEVIRTDNEKAGNVEQWGHLDVRVLDSVLKQKSIYLMGSLRNLEVMKLANTLRDAGFDVFDDWMAAGPEADDKWQTYENQRGRTFEEALQGYAACHVFEYDKMHLERCDIAVLALPAGKSGHLELGIHLGKGKPGFILYPSEPERYDVMYKFATGVFRRVEDLLEALKNV